MEHQNTYHNNAPRQDEQYGQSQSQQQGYQNGYNNQRQNSYGNQQGQSQGGYQKKPYNPGGGGYQQNNFQRKPKPDFGPIELYKPYTMVSNREAPIGVLARMTEIAKLMDGKGFTCRIDGAEGASSAVEPVDCRKEVILAWKGFNNKESQFTYTAPEALEIAKKFHPTFDTAKPAVQTFLGRNVRLVMGQTLKSPIMAMVVWTEDGAETLKDRTAKTGFAGHLIALASALGVPVFNLHNPDAEHRLNVWLENHSLTDIKPATSQHSPGQETRVDSTPTQQGNPYGYQY